MKAFRPSILLLSAFTAFGFLNCSNVKFSTGDGDSLSSLGDPGDGKNPDGSGGGGPGNPSGGSNPGGPGDTSGTIIVGGGPGGTDVSNAGGTGTPATGSGNTSAALLPKLQFIGPPCMRLTNCSITFKLDKAYAAQTEFNWRTDDALYGTPPDPGQPMWGKAGYHYVSTSGHVVFPPGTTEQTVYVRNINPDNVAISIGVIMSACQYNTLSESCQKFFAP